MSYSVINIRGIKVLSTDGLVYVPDLPGSGGDLIQDNFYFISQGGIRPSGTSQTGRTLARTDGSVSINWGTNYLYDTGDTESVDYGNRELYSVDGTLSLSWDNRILTGVLGGTETDAVSWASGVLRFIPRAADPSNVEPGSVYYNSATGKFRGYLNAASGWVNLN